MDHTCDNKSTNKDVVLSALTITVPGRTLVSDAHVAFPFNTKTAIIGRNGIGKSSLVKCLAAELSGRVVTLDQFAGDASQQDATIIDAVTSSDATTASYLAREAELLALAEDEEREYTLEDSEELERIQDHLSTRPKPHEAHVILNGLGFSDAMRHLPCRVLSGGWLQRLALAKALYARPTFFVLDEPTNHLDLDGVAWLSDYLKEYKRTIVVVSHDLVFCDTFATRFMSMTQDNVKTFATLATALKHQNVKKLSSFTFPESSFEIRQDASIQLRGISYQYGEDKPLILKNHDMCVRLDSKLIIKGPNGCGKSTLLKIILGALEPTLGEVVKNRKLRIAYLDQHEIAKMESDLTPLRYIQEVMKKDDLTAANAILSKFDLEPSKRKKQMKVLSGGEKARVLCAVIACQDPHILLLDEPTNHLDFESTMALAAAVASFPLASLIVTHNQTFIELLGDDFDAFNMQK